MEHPFGAVLSSLVKTKNMKYRCFFTANKELRSSGEASFGGADWAPFGSPFGVPLEAPGHYDHPRIPRAYHAHTVRIPNPPRGWGWGRGWGGIRAPRGLAKGVLKGPLRVP